MIGYYNYTVVATYLGLTSGIFGIFFAFAGMPLLSVYCLALSGAIDMFDGRIARRRDSSPHERRFGIQIDSLSDLVCFGVLPVCIGYAIGVRHLAFVPVMALYVLAALIRLAYFNVDEEDRQEQTDEHRHSYTGLPVTMAALIFPVVYLLGSVIPAPVYPYVYTSFMLIVAALFVSRFRLPKPGLKGAIVMLVLGVAEFAALVVWGK